MNVKVFALGASLVLTAPTIAHATDYFIQVGGVCSTDFLGGKGNARLADLPGVVSVNARVDQRDSMATATAEMRGVLDTYCTGQDWCYVYTYSNGGAVISRVLSLYNTPWNIYWVMNAASNEGGSELSYTRWAAQIFLGCGLAGRIAPSDHRSGWNHDDTNGVSFFGVVGEDGWWYSRGFLPGDDDGAVAFHSAGGFRDTYSLRSLCYDRRYYYSNHFIAFTCSGFPDDHFETKMRGICELGGC
jgi:hypothetical protein